jgi:hypothetical protein
MCQDSPAFLCPNPQIFLNAQPGREAPLVSKLRPWFQPRHLLDMFPSPHNPGTHMNKLPFLLLPKNTTLTDLCQISESASSWNHLHQTGMGQLWRTKSGLTGDGLCDDHGRHRHLRQSNGRTTIWPCQKLRQNRASFGGFLCHSERRLSADFVEKQRVASAAS